MEKVEALIFRDDVRESSPLQIHDDHFSHLSGERYYHKETGEGTIIIFGEKESYGFPNITEIMDEEDKKLAERFYDEKLIDIEDVYIAIADNFEYNIVVHDNSGIDFSLYLYGEYAEYYNEDTDQGGFIFLNENDAELFEEIEEIQDNFVMKNGLESNFMYLEEHKEKLKKLEIEVENYLKDNAYL